MIKLFFWTLLFALTISKLDLTIGAGGVGYGCGSNSPLAQSPFGFMRLGPDTTPAIKKLYTSFQHFGGYSDADRYLRGFSHMHLVGAGVQDLGIFGVLPVKQNKPQIPKDRIVSFEKYSEEAEPGYYKSLIHGEITVQLTATIRAGVHRYTFPSDGHRTIYLMAGYFLQKSKPHHATIKFLSNNSLEAQIITFGSFGDRIGGLKSFIYAEWKDEVKSKGVWNDTKLSSGTQASGNNTGAYLVVENNITLYVGLSYISTKNAKQNLYQQTKLNSFQQILASVKNVWHQQLSRFKINAVTQQDQLKLDTAIYRTFQSPTIFNDWNGDYLSFKKDGTVQKVPPQMKNVYADMSLWDVHRTQMPWILFHDAQRYNDISWSLVLVNQQGGYMPKWPFSNGPTGCMIGSHANTVLSDWIVKQGYKYLKTQEIQRIFGYMLRNANERTVSDSRYNPEKYLKYEYIIFEDQKRSSVSQTVQLSYNDFCIAQVAKLLNKTDLYEEFIRRSKFYKNVWNNKTSFFQPRSSNGTFIGLKKGEHLNIFSNYYVEGNAWHYRFYAPHDPEGLIQLFGGKQPFIKQMNIFFKWSKAWPTLYLPNPYYWAGNQHDLFTVWLYPAAGRPDLTQKYSRYIVNNFYGTKGDGLPGNDDYATMSAWLIFAELGFYPLPGTQKYILGSPMIHYAEIKRKGLNNETTTLYINVRKNSAKKYKVERFILDGQEIKELKHSSLTKNNSILEVVFE